MSKKSSQSQTPASNGTERKPKGPRKPREYRFETVDSEGKVTSLPLVLTHKDSAKRVMELLNSSFSPDDGDTKYRYTEMIVHQ